MHLSMHSWDKKSETPIDKYCQFHVIATQNYGNGDVSGHRVQQLFKLEQKGGIGVGGIKIACFCRMSFMEST